jgi:hypothetical protein
MQKSDWNPTFGARQPAKCLRSGWNGKEKKDPYALTPRTTDESGICIYQAKGGTFYGQNKKAVCKSVPPNQRDLHTV